MRPCKLYTGVRSLYSEVDFVIIRENTEDLYTGIEYEQGSPDCKGADRLDRGARQQAAAQRRRHLDQADLDHGTRQIVEFAFRYARETGRKKITAVHKANIMKFTDGLWLRTAREVAAENTDIEFEDRIVDNMCMQIVQQPGGLRRARAAEPLRRHHVRRRRRPDRRARAWRPARTTARASPSSSRPTARRRSTPGQNRVNPMAQLLSGMLMLRYLEERDAAARLERAIAELIVEGKNLTYDMNPTRDDPDAVGTSQVADALIAKLDKLR